MQARYYDPVIGRFYSNDPIGFRDIHSFNRYQYVANNPYKYTDPDGQIRRWFFRGIKNPVYSIKTAYRSVRRELRDRDIIDTPIPSEGSPVYRPGDVPVIIGHHDGEGGIVPIAPDGESEDNDSNNQYSKGGKQNTKDTGLSGYDDDEIQNLYDDSSGKARKRFEKELKSRAKKNKNKDRTGKKPPPKKKED